MTRDGMIDELRRRRRQVNKTGQSIVPNEREHFKPQKNYNVSPIIVEESGTKSHILRGSKKPILEEK